MSAYRRAVVQGGLRARELPPRFLAGLVDLCAEALRQRGRGEERYLLPIRRRLETGVLPADRAAGSLRKSGMRALVDGHTL